MGKIVQMPSKKNMSYQEVKDAQKDAIKKEGGRSLERLLRTRKLCMADREKIARKLYKLVETVFKLQPDMKHSELSQKAGLNTSGEVTSKEIWRLTLSHKSDNVKKLRAAGRNYALLIKAISKVIKRNIHELTDEITLGTAVHPTNLTYQNIDEKVLDAVQMIVNKIDKNHDLLNKFNMILNKKYDLQMQGGTCDWPFVDINVPEPDDTIFVQKKNNEDIHYLYSNYWRVGCQPDPESIAHLPHVHLGMFWDKDSDTPSDDWGSEFRLDNCTEESIQIKKEFNKKYGHIDPKNDEEFEDYKKLHSDFFKTDIYKNKTVFDSVPRKVEFNTDTKKTEYHDCYGLMANLDYWLVLYPNKEMSAIEPVLWSHGGEYTFGENYIESLNLRTLNEMHKISVISRRNETLYDRLINFLKSGTESEGIYRLYKEWDKTAEYLEYCPLWDNVKATQDLDLELDKILSGGLDDIK